MAGLIIANIIVWDHYLQVARYDPDAPNIPAVIWSYFSNGDRLSELWKDLLFGKGLQGSAIYIKSAVFLYLIPLMFWLQKLLPDRLRPLHTNWLMIGLMSLSTFVGLTVLGIAQTENWYWNPITVTCPDGSTVAAEVQGAFGFACHFIIIWIFARWNSQFDYMKPFGLTGRFGQFMKSVLVFLGLGVLEVYWQIVESMNPERYVNFYGDGLGDILVSVASTFVISLLMYWIVYDHVIYMSFRGSLNRLKLELKTL